MSGGRPSSFRPEYPEQAFKLCLLGATDVELARFFEVAEATISNWKNAHPEFLEALKEGKEQADAKVAQSLYHRALGYSHSAVKIVADAKTGAEHIVPYTERFPPDTTACIFWLKNRRPDMWRDKQTHEHSGTVNTGVLMVPESPENWHEAVKESQANLTDSSANRVAALARAPKGNGKKNGDGP